MVPTIVFYISLTGLLAMLALKLWEMKRGVKPFSVIHYKADMALRKQMATLRGNLRYLNRETLKLLLLYLYREGRELALKLWGMIEHWRVFEMVRGRDIVKGNGAVSSFLKKLSADIRESGIPEDEGKK